MNAAWEAIKNAANIAFVTIKLLITNVLSAIGAVISFYVNFYKSVWNGLQALWSIAKALFARVVSAVLSFANDVKSRFVALVAGALTAWQRLKDLPRVLAGILSAVIGRVAAWAGSFVSRVRSAASAAVSALRGGLSAAAGAVSSALGGALAAAAGFVGRFVSVGRDLIMGVARGISSAVGAVASAARNAASNALSAAKGFLGISSPSKVARDQIGREFTRGIAAGIPAEVKAAEDAAVATMRAVVSAAKTQSGQVPLFAGAPGRVDIPKEYFAAAAAHAQTRPVGDTIINGTFGYDPAEVARELQKRRSRDLAVSLPVGVV
jgi:phage-related protein